MKNRCIQLAVILYILLPISFPSHAQASTNPVINEFLAHPKTGDKEWIELYNPDKTDLSNLFIDDDTSFNDDAGSGSKKPLADLLASDSAYPYVELSSFLNNSGDSVVIFDSSGNIIDQTEYTDDPGTDISIGRYPDKTGTFVILAQSTKGSANSQPQPTPTTKPTNTPTPTPTPKTTTPTKTPTPIKTSTTTSTTNLKDTSSPTQKKPTKTPSKTPSKSLTKKITVSPAKRSSRSATPKITPKKDILGANTKSEKTSSPSPIIFITIASVLFIICAILIALKIKWKKQ